MRRVPRRTDLWPRWWRRRPLPATACLLATACLAWIRLSSAGGNDYEQFHNQTVLCNHCVDGDTIDISLPDGTGKHTRIRLWGVDTPESAKSTSGAMYYGQEASDFTRSLVEGKSVRILLAPQRARDRYGRLLAYVYLQTSQGELLLNEQIIADGYGYADRRFDHVWRLRFEQLEEKAQKQKRGLWTRLRPDQMPPWRQRYLQKREAWRHSEDE